LQASRTFYEGLKASRSEITSLRVELQKAMETNTKRTEELAALIGSTAAPVPQRPITPPPTERMDVDVAIPATLPPAHEATPATNGGTKRRRDQVSGGLVSPPATPKKKTVRITSPPPTLMHSKHASAGEPPSTQTGAKEKGKEGANKQAKEPKEKEKMDGWTTVERKRRGGRVKRARGAEIVDRGGVTTFWSTPDGLYESWRPQKDRYEGKRKQADARAATEGCMTAGGRRRAATWDKDRPTHGRQR